MPAQKAAVKVAIVRAGQAEGEGGEEGGGAANGAAAASAGHAPALNMAH